MPRRKAVVRAEMESSVPADVPEQLWPTFAALRTLWCAGIDAACGIAVVALRAQSELVQGFWKALGAIDPPAAGVPFVERRFRSIVIKFPDRRRHGTSTAAP